MTDGKQQLIRRGKAIRNPIRFRMRCAPAFDYGRTAQFYFEKMLSYANHLGLYAEETGSSGEQFGNFPKQ